MVYNLLNEEIIEVPRFNEESGFYATAERSKLMKRIKSKNTKAELVLRQNLWKRGMRYSLNNSNLPGKPDIVFVKKKIAVFVDGNFWHGYNWELKKSKLKSNSSYWIPKIERNIQRDRENNLKLESQGWLVLRFWDHEILKKLDDCLGVIINSLQNRR